MPSPASSRKRVAKAAERALVSESFYHAFDDIPIGVVIHVEGTIRYANMAAARLHAMERPFSLIGCQARDFVHPDDLNHALERGRRVRETGVAAPSMDLRLRRQDGSYVHVQSHISLTNYKGEAAVLAVYSDISEKKSAEEALRHSEANLRYVLDATQEGLYVHRDGKILSFNDRLLDMLGYDAEDLQNEKAINFVAPSRRQQVRRILQSEGDCFYESAALHKDGREIPVEVSVKSRREGDHVLRYVAVRNISERVRAETELRERERMLSEAQRIGRIGHWRLDSNLKIVEWSDQMYEIYGLDHATFNMSFDTVSAGIDPEFRERAVENRNRAIEEHQPYVFQYGFTMPSGEKKVIRGEGWPEYDEDDQFKSIFGISQDVTEEVQAANDLRESEERLRTLLEAAPIPLVISVEGKYVYANALAHELFGVPEGGLVGRSPAQFYADSTRCERAFEIIRREGQVTNLDVEMRRADGTLVETSISARRVRYAGKDAVFTGIVDLSDLRTTQAQLHQAQKMEAVGQLTGGIAHDFNNLLADILGNEEMVREDVGEGVLPSTDIVKSIVSAAERGAGLTDQLLAFSRKQSLTPETLDLGRQAEQLVNLLRRTLGATIEVEISQDDGLWLALADPGQLQNALLNLAVNARDAMPDGGRLMIESRNVHVDRTSPAGKAGCAEGDYVMLAVSDTGSGMSQEVIDRVFEPFFTTKDPGKGTGLGLSMVFGFAKQSDGHVEVDSDQGRGTTINLYLPRAASAEASGTENRKSASPSEKGEVVLVLEDSAEVLELVTVLLRSLGYRVLEATNGDDALHLLDSHEPIDVLLSDVILPGGMKGPDVARAALTRKPSLKVVYMSGYTDDAVLDHAVLEGDSVLLQKPFKKQELAETLNSILSN